jgi:hypothetical protein
MPLNGKLSAASPHTAPARASRPLTMKFCL